jgi:hypothetical protein
MLEQDGAFGMPSTVDESFERLESLLADELAGSTFRA